MSSSSHATSSYWCYRCNRSVAVSVLDDSESDVSCPHCDSGFVEQIQSNSHDASAASERPNRIPTFRFRRARRNAGDRSQFNPVVVLRGASATGTPDNNESTDGGGNTTGNYEFYYDDGTGSGLRPVPATMSEFLMGSGFDRLLDQLTQIELNTLTRTGNPPASKAAVESMPALKICETHVDAELHCAVCTEVFELESEAREMPCKHIYHSECILPWLAIRNSCPVCRHELPADQEGSDGNNESSSGAVDEEIVGLTIWRLPGGGFAVGRFRGGAERERELPVPGVFTEVDGGGFGGGGSGSGSGDGVGRRRSWVSSRSGESSGSGGGGRGGLRRAIHGLVSFVRRIRRVNNDDGNSDSDMGTESSSSHYGSSGILRRSWSQSSNGFRRFLRGSRRERRGLDLEVENGTADRW